MAYLCHRFCFILFFFSPKKKQKGPWPIVAIDQNSFGPCNLFKMATARIRNNDWQEDERLIEALTRYVKENLCRNEVLEEGQRQLHITRPKLGSFSGWPRQVNGLSKQHFPYRCLWLHGHLQPKSALGKGLG